MGHGDQSCVGIGRAMPSGRGTYPHNSTVWEKARRMGPGLLRLSDWQLGACVRWSRHRLVQPSYIYIWKDTTESSHTGWLSGRATHKGREKR
jgi:hypothetical protein